MPSGGLVVDPRPSKLCVLDGAGTAERDATSEARGGAADTASRCNMRSESLKEPHATRGCTPRHALFRSRVGMTSAAGLAKARAGLFFRFIRHLRSSSGRRPDLS